MASKGPRSKLDHETRIKKQKALEPAKEPRRPKTHWDHVLEEMVWLSKDFELERKWKLSQAKKVALRASKGMVDQATRGERKLKEEELRLRKVAVNISKDVKKFWMKIEKLVLYKHQLDLDEKRKKALDKQLEFLLGQTERYSTMLAENLVVDSKVPHRLMRSSPSQEQLAIRHRDQTDIDKCDGSNVESYSKMLETDEEYDLQSGDETEDDEHTIEEDEALITEEERQEELAALHNEIDLPLEELLKRYSWRVSNENTLEKSAYRAKPAEGMDDGNTRNDICSDIRIIKDGSTEVPCVGSNGSLLVLENQFSDGEADEIQSASKRFQEPDKKQLTYDFDDEIEDGDFVLANGEEKDDEDTLSEEEKLAEAEPNGAADEITLLQQESEVPIEELLARYRQDSKINKNVKDDFESDSDSASASASASTSASESEDSTGSPSKNADLKPHLVSISEVDVPSEPSQKKEPDLIPEERGVTEDRIADAAAAARSAQPTGNTFSTTKVKTKYPFLLKFSLREYQHIGLDWLVAMYEKRLNGILADEMGLGKTIMTIALLAHLACEKGIWGPHLIVVPTSVMLNWETEFLKWCPAFKILTYFGSAKERRNKRQGWMKPNSFHVCISTYRLVIQDSKIFKRKKWKYLILDEAHLIKNWKSQRWQTLLNFNTKRRILLTGTPLQNDLMELWSLMHFLMPHIFQSHQEFKDWFSNPISGMVEGQEKVNKEVVDRLHVVLRPFILRRLKRDVEKQLPVKHEHVIYCRLSRRQRNLYEDFIASSETQATLASANFFGMISVIMQLRKVCNHPDLFEGRPIVSSYDMNSIDLQLSSSVCSVLTLGPFSTVDLYGFGLIFTHLDFSMTSWECDEVQAIATPTRLIEGRAEMLNYGRGTRGIKRREKSHGFNFFEEIQNSLLEERLREAKERAASIAWWNSLRCKKKPIYSTSLRELVSVKHPVFNIHHELVNPLSYLQTSSKLADVVLSPVDRFQKMVDLVESFMFAIPAARAAPPFCWCSKPGTSAFVHESFRQSCSLLLSPLLTAIRPAIVRRQLYFPDRRLIQFDCGKLQELAVLLRQLKSEGHRALIFTQMTKMLDILEAFINLYGYTYMRLDGSTQPEERQTLMQRFNTNPKFFLFILSTRSGGVGINLVGADTVVFYDSDWNPAMDQQAQDRCHRIGQTREVHIYRLISESTIEENILRKAKQKRALDDLVIQSGEYNTEFFKKLDPVELFSGHRAISVKNDLSNADVEAALKHAEDEADYMALKKVEEEEAVDNQEFTEEVIGRPEDDEFAIEEDIKNDDADLVMASTKDNVKASNGIIRLSEETNIKFGGKDDDVDMFADVKQMAAAAAVAGDEILSFENQLRPIDRYAMRFLELWDPIIDKAAIESEFKFVENEWELEHIEKLKEDMEAEGDDDDEPFVYERWDSDFATEAYRQQVEALAQHQMMEELESEAREKERADSDPSNRGNESRPKSKKKSKKTKFKSLKKEALDAETIPTNVVSPAESLSIDDEIFNHESSSPNRELPESTGSKKRKTTEGSKMNVAKKFKKLEKPPEPSPSLPDPVSLEKQRDVPKDKKMFQGVSEIEHKRITKSKIGLKISISAMPMKRVITIKPEKIKKRVSKDCFPEPDTWLPSEDAILSAVVHEYGPHWSLVSDVLCGTTGGGFYRGIFRHPVHCCERFRELIQQYVLSAIDSLHNEKSGNAGSAKALLKVTEDHVQVLLDVASELPDQEQVVQKHFFSLLSSVWRKGQQSYSSFETPRVYTLANHNSQYPMKQQSLTMEFTNLVQISEVVAAALHDLHPIERKDRIALSEHREEAPATVDELGISLEILAEEDDEKISLPCVVNLSICSHPLLSLDKSCEANCNFKSSSCTAENRLGEAYRAWIEGSLDRTSSGNVNFLTQIESQSVGQKMCIPEPALKPSKSKMKKTMMDTSNMSYHSYDTVSKSTTVLIESRFEETRSFLPAISIDDFVGTSSFDMENELGWETDNFDVVPHNYVPAFISELEDFSLWTEDCSPLTEFIDVG